MATDIGMGRDCPSHGRPKLDWPLGFSNGVLARVADICVRVFDYAQALGFFALHDLPSHCNTWLGVHVFAALVGGYGQPMTGEESRRR
jgi:hypothetical protein